MDLITLKDIDLIKINNKTPQFTIAENIPFNWINNVTVYSVITDKPFYFIDIDVLVNFLTTHRVSLVRPRENHLTRIFKRLSAVEKFLLQHNIGEFKVINLNKRGIYNE